MRGSGSQIGQRGHDGDSNDARALKGWALKGSVNVSPISSYLSMNNTCINTVQAFIRDGFPRRTSSPSSGGATLLF